MSITKKKYVEVIQPYQSIGNYGFYVMSDSDGKYHHIGSHRVVDAATVIEHPINSNATDLEKLEWVLKEIGIEYFIDGYKDKKQMIGLLGVGVWFDHNGKLIK